MGKRNKRAIVKSPAGLPVDLSKKPATGSYAPVPHIWFQQPIDLPIFDFRTIRAMLMDEGVRLNFETRSAPIFGLEFGWEENKVWQEGVKCRDQAIGQFIYRQLQRIWKTFLPSILRAQIWGWSAGEVRLKMSPESKLIEIADMLPRHPMDCILLKLDNERWGVQIKRTLNGAVNLPFPYAWFHSYDAQDGEDYGTSAAYGAYSPWADKWFDGGAKSVRRLFMHKDAYGGADISYPVGQEFMDQYNNPVDNRDIARQIAENIRSGSVTTRPSKYDENGHELWKIDRATIASNPAHILEYPKDLDAEIRHGMGIPDDVINSGSTGAWNGKAIPMQSFYSSLDSWVVQILRDLCSQIIDPLLRLNFKNIPEYETTFKPLAKQAMEQQNQNQASPKGMPQDMQGGMNLAGDPGVMDPQGLPQPQQPIAMGLSSNDDILEYARSVFKIVTMGAGAVDDENAFEFNSDRIEALAELLASIFGDKAEEVLDEILPKDKPITLSVWNPSDHPRGRDGRFIPKGTDEAYSAAKEKVDEAHRSRSPESMSSLMAHLNTLTTKQLHGLKREYGTKASARTKAALIEKLTERLTSGKHRTAERDDGTPVAPVRENVYTVKPDSLSIDPERFQYKVKGIGAKGVGEELKGTKKWNPELGGVLLVWRDPSNGKDYVVNGHHRHELATRAGADSLNVRYIDATSAKVARSVGALANIAEGRGSAIDAAKYLRDTGQDVEHFRNAGISMSGKIASDASNLVKLSDKAFAAVTQGKMDEDKAVAVAKHLSDHDLQDKLFKKIWDREDDGKDWSAREIEAASKKMARAGKITESGTDLFGDWESEESTFDQEVEIESYINRALSQEANDYNAVSSQRRADRVAESGNVINVDANLSKRDSARGLLDDFERESGYKGAVADEIKSFAAKLAKAKKKTEKESIKKEALSKVKEMLSTPKADKPPLEMDTRSNANANDGDQLGLFGDISNEFQKAAMKVKDETRGKQDALFDTTGDPDQFMLFDDGVTPLDRLSKQAREKRLKDFEMIAMSLLKGDIAVDDLELTPEEAAEVESLVRKMAKQESDTIAMGLLRMSVDKTGHEHKGKGPGGGQFVSKGGGGSGNEDSPAEKTNNANTQEKQGQNDSLPPKGEKRAPSGDSRAPTKDVLKTEVDSESITPPPPGKAFLVDVEKTGPDGVAVTARVGIPGRLVAPPPPIPKLPNLTERERKVESTFMKKFMADPDGMANDYRKLIAGSSKPYTFETDQAKCLSDDWNDENLDVQMQKRQLHNNALHQTANAIVKRAFLMHLNTLSPGDKVLVTVGGCGSGKGYTLKNTELGKNLTAEAKAVWDSAGDQNATENPWILEECKKRGLKVTYAYVAGDPKVAWAHPERGVVKRAHDNSDGRMVDAAVFADSYALGARNHHAFHQANKNDPDAKFLFFSAADQSALDGVPPESLKVDRKSLYHWALGSIQSRNDVSPSVLRGATQGVRIWNNEFFGG